MAVKKIGSRWHPIGAKGPWKSSYATEAKAKKGLADANRYFKSQRKGSKKKRSPGTKKKKSKSKGSGKRMTKKKGKNKKTWKTYMDAGIKGTLLAWPEVRSLMSHITDGNWERFPKTWIENRTGYNTETGVWDPARVATNYGITIGGLLLWKIAKKAAR